MSDVSREYYKVVPATTIDTDEVVVPNGTTYSFEHWILQASPTNDTEVSVVWDYQGAGEEILSLTHGSLTHQVNKRRTGDGIKKLAIVLKNNSNGGISLGAEFIAEEV